MFFKGGMSFSKVVSEGIMYIARQGFERRIKKAGSSISLSEINDIKVCISLLTELTIIPIKCICKIMVFTNILSNFIYFSIYWGFGVLGIQETFENIQILLKDMSTEKEYVLIVCD